MNLFELFVKIGVDDQASGKLSKLSSSLGAGLATAAKIGVAAVGAASTAIAGLTKSAVESYAEYEQLVGGVQTLFEDLSWDVQQNAGKAFETAGLSANEYMSTAMSFAASLNQSLLATEGNIARSADLTNQAIIDMADNANKMGTNMEMIQNAYQGFAKQNYTMLDNLKLGYGGTKQEMERLLKDASKLSGIEYDISSFADIVEAIHVVQTEMGITGTTAAEAASTISGSVASMGAAWTNLVTGLADDEADFDALMNDFVGSVKTVVDNIAPRIGIALNGVGKLIKEIVPVAMQYIPQIIGEFLPEIASAAVGIVTSIGGSITKNLGKILNWGQDILDTLIDGIMKTSDSDISETVTDIITSLGNFVISNLPQVLSAGIEILFALSNGIIDAIPELAEAATQAIVNFASYLISGENISNIIETAGNLIKNLGNGIKEAARGLFGDVGANVVQSIIDGISSAWDGLVSWFNGIWDSLFGNRSVNVNVNKSSRGSGHGPINVNGSHELGLDYVPFDGYIAELHKGERVLTEKESKSYGTKNTYGDIIIQVSGAEHYDENSLAEAIAEKFQMMADGKAAVYA